MTEQGRARQQDQQGVREDLSSPFLRNDLAEAWTISGGARFNRRTVEHAVVLRTRALGLQLHARLDLDDNKRGQASWAGSGPCVGKSERVKSERRRTTSAQSAAMPRDTTHRGGRAGAAPSRPRTRRHRTGLRADERGHRRIRRRTVAGQRCDGSDALQQCARTLALLGRGHVGRSERSTSAPSPTVPAVFPDAVAPQGVELWTQSGSHVIRRSARRFLDASRSSGKLAQGVGTPARDARAQSTQEAVPALQDREELCSMRLSRSTQSASCAPISCCPRLASSRSSARFHSATRLPQL